MDSSKISKESFHKDLLISLSKKGNCRFPEKLEVKETASYQSFWTNNLLPKRDKSLTRHMHCWWENETHPFLHAWLSASGCTMDWTKPGHNITNQRGVATGWVKGTLHPKPILHPFPCNCFLSTPKFWLRGYWRTWKQQKGCRILPEERAKATSSQVTIQSWFRGETTWLDRSLMHTTI